MGLSGGLSNTAFTEVLAKITSDLRHKEKRRPQQPLLGYSDGRRKFGTVSAAIRRVMEEAGCELCVLEVRRRVEVLLGGQVSRFTVADHLLKRSTGEAARYERIRRGFYRLRVSTELGANPRDQERDPK